MVSSIWSEPYEFSQFWSIWFWLPWWMLNGQYSKFDPISDTSVFSIVRIVPRTFKHRNYLYVHLMMDAVVCLRSRTSQRRCKATFWWLRCIRAESVHFRKFSGSLFEHLCAFNTKSFPRMGGKEAKKKKKGAITRRRYRFYMLRIKFLARCL